MSEVNLLAGILFFIQVLREFHSFKACLNQGAAQFNMQDSFICKQLLSGYLLVEYQLDLCLNSILKISQLYKLQSVAKPMAEKNVSGKYVFDSLPFEIIEKTRGSKYTIKETNQFFITLAQVIIFYLDILPTLPGTTTLFQIPMPPLLLNLILFNK